MVMDHRGVKCETFYNLQDRACADLILEYDVQLQNRENKFDYLKNVLEHGMKMNG
ncbi:hypothetical protein ACHAWF_016760, partial [Thalassiosira exigua]